MMFKENLTARPGFLLRFARAAGIRSGEEETFSLLLGQSAFLGVALITYYSSANALFLSRFGAEMLPYVYMAAAVVIIFSGLGFSKLQSTIPFSILLVGNLSLLAGVVAVLWVLLRLSGADWVYFAVLIWLRVLWALGNLGLWALAGRLFTVRQGKRLFSLIMAGGVFAIILTGLLNNLLIRWLGMQNILWITVGSLLGALWLLVITLRRFPKSLEIPSHDAHQSEPQEKSLWRQPILRDRYVWFIFFYTMLSTVGTYVLDYAFIGQAEARMTNPEQLGKFFGNYMGISTLAALIFLLVAANKIFRRFGVRGGLVVDPISVGVGAVAVAALTLFPDMAGAVFWVVVGTKLADEVTVAAMTNSSVRIMYQPLPKKERSLVQAFVESVISPLSMGISGGLLLLFAKLWSLTSLQAIYLLLIVLVGWVGMGLLLGGQYYGALQRALDKRLLSGGEAYAFEDSASTKVLEKHLASDNPGDVLFAMSVLAKNSEAGLKPFIPDLLNHPHAEVRLTAIQHLDFQNEAALRHLTGVLQAQSQPPTVQAAALRVITRAGYENAFQILESFLAHPDLEVRRGAAVGLFQSGTLEGILAAGEVLLTSQRGASVDMRCFAAQVMGDVGNAGFYRNLLQLLADPESRVRQEAVLASGKVNHPRLWPVVVEAVSAADTRSAALTALAAGGAVALPYIGEALQQPTSPRAARDLLRVCGRIGGENVGYALKGLLSYPRERTRTELLRVLARTHYQAEAADRAKIIQQIETEIKLLMQLAHTAADLVEHSADAFQPLHNVLAQMFSRGQLRVLDLLAMLFDPQDVLRIRMSVLREQEERRANAIEILDVILSGEGALRRLVVPVVAAQTAIDLTKQLGKQYPRPDGALQARLLAFFSQDEPQLKNDWLSVCALYAAAELSTEAIMPALLEALSHPVDVLREMAFGIVLKSGQAPLHTILEQFADDPVPQLSLLARKLAALSEFDGDFPMLLTIEKVLILKTADIFSETPDDVLAELARYLEEVEVAAGETIFEKGDLGNSMYIIISGRMRVHDGARTVSMRGDREVFGEMALLDSAPRSASVTAVENTRLLRLDQDPFYEAVDTRSEISRGVMQVLSRRLREAMNAGG